MHRREFLRRSGRAGAVAMCAPAAIGGLMAGCTSYRYVTYQHEGDRLLVAKADLAESPFVLLRNPQEGERPIYLHHHENGTFSAVLTRCTHRGCQVKPAGSRLACPCHGSEFSLTGDLLAGPADRPLLRYDVTTDADHITIRIT